MNRRNNMCTFNGLKLNRNLKKRTFKVLQNKTQRKTEFVCIVTSKINDTPKDVRFSEKLQITAALCNEI